MSHLDYVFALSVHHSVSVSLQKAMEKTMGNPINFWSRCDSNVNKNTMNINQLHQSLGCLDSDRKPDKEEQCNIL